jgi:hypothetical protein
MKVTDGRAAILTDRRRIVAILFPGCGTLKQTADLSSFAEGMTANAEKATSNGRRI